MQYLWLLVPLFMALMRLVTRKYVFSALVTLSCAVIALIPGVDASGLIMAAGLLFSIAGDYLLAHQHGKSAVFIEGVACFGIAHVLFILYAVQRFMFRPLAVGFIIVLAAFYALYLTRRVLPGQPQAMKGALLGYALVSLMGLFAALSMDAAGAARTLYIFGIASIVFSDTMIAEAEFARRKQAHMLILPTYYLCHVLLAASRLAAM